jgi:thiol:disulfide interchange protein
MRTQGIAAAFALTIGAVLAGGGLCAAQTTGSRPASADAVVAGALKSAQSGKRVVLIEFGASWCIWCRSFEAFVHAPEVREIIANNYVVANLTVQERDDKKALENAGAQEKMNAWGGEKSGLPYYVFLDGSGRKIADSNAMPDGGNIGFPATPQELQVFMSLIDRTAPKLSAPDRSKIAAYLNRILTQ